MRIVIAGVPKAGKTPFAHELGGAHGYECPPGAGCRHTDDLIDPGRDWSEVSEIVASAWFAEPGPWIIEGVAAVRALRKWFAANPMGKPCDRVIWFDRPLIILSPGRRTMAKGCRTIWEGTRGEVLARGIQLEER